MVDTRRARFRFSLTKFGQSDLANDDVKVAEGAFCEVWFLKKIHKVYAKAPAKDRARIERIVDHISEEGPRALNDQQYKSEGRFPTGGTDSKDAMVYVLKSFQLRIYGCWNDGPPRRFMCAEASIKKVQKADQDQLKRVAKSVGE